jgi:hypothetical protein
MKTTSTERIMMREAMSRNKTAADWFRDLAFRLLEDADRCAELEIEFSDWIGSPKDALRRRMKVAESELARLREGLRGLETHEMLGSDGNYHDVWVDSADIAALLEADE